MRLVYSVLPFVEAPVALAFWAGTLTTGVIIKVKLICYQNLNLTK